jgi:hypothetical protein
VLYGGKYILLVFYFFIFVGWFMSGDYDNNN